MSKVCRTCKWVRYDKENEFAEFKKGMCHLKPPKIEGFPKVMINLHFCSKWEEIEEICSLTREQIELRNKKVVNAKPHLNRPSNINQFMKESDVILSDWECESSPVGICAYDRYGYNGTDECLFCGDPWERK